MGFTVKELIEKLSLIEDKTKEVVLSHEFGESEFGEPLPATFTETEDYVVVS